MKIQNKFYCVLNNQELRSQALRTSDIVIINAILEDYGFVVIENLLDVKALSSLNEKMNRDYGAFKESKKKWIGGGLKMGNLNAAPPTCNEFISREILLNRILHDVTSIFFNQDTVNIAYTANTNTPGSHRQSFHSDNRSLNMDYLTISIPLCDVDESNGSTEMIPRTHRSKFSPIEVYKELHKSVRINTKLGSAIIWFCSTWHRGTANGSAACRHMINLNHTYSSSRTFHDSDGIPIPESTLKSLILEGSRMKTCVGAEIDSTLFKPNYFGVGPSGWIKEIIFLSAPRTTELLYAVYKRLRDR